MRYCFANTSPCEITRAFFLPLPSGFLMSGDFEMQQKNHAKPTQHRRKDHIKTLMTARSYYGNLIAIVHRVHSGVSYV